MIIPQNIKIVLPYALQAKLFQGDTNLQPNWRISNSDEMRHPGPVSCAIGFPIRSTRIVLNLFRNCTRSGIASTADISSMRKRLLMKKSVRCTYLKACYLAEALECYGFKIDCPLFMRANGEVCNDARFHAAMDDLIRRTKRKHDVQKCIGAASKPTRPVGKESTSRKVKA